VPPEPTETVRIQTETIRLDQFLKWSGAVETGGEAKLLIQAGRVLVDGQVDTRRGRTLQRGAVVKVEGRTFRCA
jgi:ribosome-associated protein